MKVEIAIRGKDQMLIVTMPKEIDHHSVKKIRQMIDMELGRTGAKNIAFNFTDVSFMDSSGIGLIMGRFKVVRNIGGSVILFGADDGIEHMIKMSGVDKYTIIEKTLEEALLRLLEVKK